MNTGTSKNNNSIFKVIEQQDSEFSLKRTVNMNLNLSVISSFDQEANKKRKTNKSPEPYNESEIIISNDEESEQVISQEQEINQETIAALNSLDFEIDNFFKKVLKPHQVEGLKFMWEKVYENKQGCLLAHSMGLGKSIQTICLLITMFQYKQKNPSTHFPTGNRVLLLAPLITLSNWVNEFEKWSINDAENIIGEVFNFSEVEIGEKTRTTYLKYWFDQGGILLMHYDQYRFLLTNPKYKDETRQEFYKYLVNPGPDIVVLDEGHRIKNVNSSISGLVYKIRTRSRICLTGYPVQNNLMEYYYMINFIAPNLLGNKNAFKSKFKTTIEKCYSDSPKSKKLHAAVKLYVLQLLTGYVSHRRDDTILKQQLPEKTEYVVRFKMSPIQYEGYCQFLKHEQADGPMIALIGLRAICNHPKSLEMLLKNRYERNRNKLLDQEYRNQDLDNDEIDQEIIKIPKKAAAKEVEEGHHALHIDDNDEELSLNFSIATYDLMKEYLEGPDIESWKCSGKMSFIADLAQNCNALKEKLVIVSHSLACLSYIQQLLPIFGIKVARIDGHTVGMHRQKIIDSFQDDLASDVMLLSAKAAAIGINLTAANRIVLIDQDWNPLYDEQSIGRVYRYGQNKPVYVYRLITDSTIEERIFIQSIHKRSISKRVIDNKMALDISRDDLVEYYKLPNSDLQLINMDTDITKSVEKDYITMSVLRQNTGCITKLQQYEEDIKEHENVTAWMEKLSEHDRNNAKAEALELFKNWKQTELLK